MNDEKDRDLQRLFAAYAPVMPEEPFLAHTSVALIRQIRRARAHAVIRYALLGLAGAMVAVATAAPLRALGIAVERTVGAMNVALPPFAAQGLVYTVTAAVLILGRRRIGAYLGPW